MREETFTKIAAALIDQYQEDCYKSKTFEEMFRTEESIDIQNRLIDEVFDALIQEYQPNEEIISIAVDIIFNDILAFKYNGAVYESTVQNLYKLFNKDIV